jgi:SAM-dependent methyltransferase
MNWKIKAWLQRSCNAIPAGGLIYHQFQKYFGGLRLPEYMNKFNVQKKMAQSLHRHGVQIAGAEVVEVGTGWIPLVPIGYWLCGAARVRTYDLNRYLQVPLLQNALHWISNHSSMLVEHYAPVVPMEKLAARFELLENLKDRPEDFLREARIEYHAPADASRTGLPDESVDIHFSANCFEHIPGNVLSAILREARRVLKPDGLAMHHVDPSDHFAHCDPSISSINFLQYEPDEWRCYNDNRFAYHNRLRDADYRRVFRESSLEIAEGEFQVDPRALSALQKGFPLARAYRDKPFDELSRYRLDYVARPGMMTSVSLQAENSNLQAAGSSTGAA